MLNSALFKNGTAVVRMQHDRHVQSFMCACEMLITATICQISSVKNYFAKTRLEREDLLCVCIEGRLTDCVNRGVSG